MIYPHAEYCGWWDRLPCTCGMTRLMKSQNKVPWDAETDHAYPDHPEPKKSPPLRCVFGWHLYRIAHGMYDDLCVDCTLCEVTHYTGWLEVWVYKITGRLVS